MNIIKQVAVVFCIQLIFVGVMTSQSIEGAWKWEGQNESGEPINAVVITVDGYQTVTFYESDSGEFIRTSGGSYKTDGNTVTEVVEFDSADSSRVGKTESFQYEMSENTIKIVDVNQIWTRIDDGHPGELAGAWLFSGRKRDDGTFSERDVDQPRKTMKILSGTRFQWIAYNTLTKKFMATGGGTYTTVNGEYTENIEFFSRDVSRVGASLQFDYELKDGRWHHSGNNSRGEPMHEIWSARE